MRHSEDDVVHKVPHKMKAHKQNQLKISVLVNFKILYRIRHNKMVREPNVSPHKADNKR